MTPWVKPKELKLLNTHTNILGYNQTAHAMIKYNTIHPKCEYNHHFVPTYDIFVNNIYGRRHRHRSCCCCCCCFYLFIFSLLRLFVPFFNHFFYLWFAWLLAHLLAYSLVCSFVNSFNFLSMYSQSWTCLKFHVTFAQC